MSQGTDASGRIHDYEYAVMWYSKGVPNMSADQIDDWFDTYEEALADMVETIAILNQNRKSRFGLGIVRRVKAGPLEKMLNKDLVIHE